MFESVDVMFIHLGTLAVELYEMVRVFFNTVWNLIPWSAYHVNDQVKNQANILHNIWRMKRSFLCAYL